jgi:uncharacterized protein (DUF1778 family)
MLEVNNCSVSDDMRKALEDPELDLNLDTYFSLDDKNNTLTRTRAVLSMIYERPINGYADKNAIQKQLDMITQRLTAFGPEEELPVPKTSVLRKSDPDFFPLGVWLQAPSRAQAYKEIGMNTFVGLWNGLNSEALDYFRRADMKVICEMNKFAVRYIEEQPGDNTITGWMQWDEPDNAQNTGSAWGPPVDPGSVIIKYNQIKAFDPARPVFLGLGQGVAWNYPGRGIDTGKNYIYTQYIKGADIICFDVYPANAEEKEIHNKLWLVPKGIDNLHVWDGDKKPAWAWIETGSINGVYRPTPEQIKAEVWMAIIHGAKGIGYFLHEFNPSFHEAGILTDPANSVNKEKIASLNKQITCLAPVINTPSQNFAAVTLDNKEIPIDIMSKEYHGDKYIFAAAMREGTTTASFTVSPKTDKAVTVISEGRTVNMSKGQFCDVFKPFDIHIYKINI